MNQDEAFREFKLFLERCGYTAGVIIFIKNSETNLREYSLETASVGVHSAQIESVFDNAKSLHTLPQRTTETLH